jgi:hypothetical protein
MAWVRRGLGTIFLESSFCFAKPLDGPDGDVLRSLQKGLQLLSYLAVRSLLISQRVVPMTSDFYFSSYFQQLDSLVRMLPGMGQKMHHCWLDIWTLAFQSSTGHSLSLTNKRSFFPQEILPEEIFRLRTATSSILPQGQATLTWESSGHYNFPGGCNYYLYRSQLFWRSM